jgi:Fe-S cluster assembly protein SufD
MNQAPSFERMADARTGLPGGAAWTKRRERALGTLRAHGLPDRRDENWKYLDHARIAAYPFDAPPAVAARAAVLPDSGLLPIEGARRVVLVDGRFDAALSNRLASPGLEVLDLAVLLDRDPAAALELLRQPGEEADDRYALLADAFATGGVLVRVEEGRDIAEPLYVVHVASASEPAVRHSRVVIHAGAHARLMVVEHFVTSGDAAVLGNLAAEVVLAEGAAVTHLRLHQQSSAAAQVESWFARLAAGSRYDHHLLALGGGLLRSDLRVALVGAGASCRLDGLFLADGERQVDLLTRVDHHGAATKTVQDYRGIAAGGGRGALNGRIVVHPTARGADASQSSRNLLLTPLAEINTRPQLEIHVDDVQCRHGATTGTLDDAQLFYLVSRGLDPAAARAVLTFAFCQDLVGRVPLEPVRAAAQALVAATLPVDGELLQGPA